MVFKLDIGQISFNLVEKAFAIQQLSLYSILAWVYTEIKILEERLRLVMASYGWHRSQLNHALHDAQNVCVQTKGGTVLNNRFSKFQGYQVNH